MKREELLSIGLSGDQVKEVLSLYGRDVRRYKVAGQTFVAQQEEMQRELLEARTRIEELSSRNTEKTGDEVQQWKSRAEAVEQELRGLRMETALDRVLKRTGARNAKAVLALMDLKSAAESQDVEEELMRQAEQVKAGNGFLFDGAGFPELVRPGAERTESEGGFFDSARRAAGLDG